MRPVDYRGRVLYDDVWDRVYFYGSQLLERGYVEAARKPNLFLLPYRAVTFFAGLRGTRDLAIWDDHRPLFWWQIDRTVHLDHDVLARMVMIEAARLDPIPLRTTYMPSDETLPVLAEISEHDLLDRPEPACVPKAPYVSVFSGRLHTYVAIDGQTDERVMAQHDGADRTYLRCALCRERLMRQWDPDLQRFFFDHRRGRCPMQYVS